MKISNVRFFSKNDFLSGFFFFRQLPPKIFPSTRVHFICLSTLHICNARHVRCRLVALGTLKGLFLAQVPQAVYIFREVLPGSTSLSLREVLPGSMEVLPGSTSQFGKYFPEVLPKFGKYFREVLPKLGSTSRKYFHTSGKYFPETQGSTSGKYFPENVNRLRDLSQK